MREAIGSRTLDELLGAKGELDREIGSSARIRIEQHGLRLASAGIKDVILPGEMKEILNRVVEAEKVAHPGPGDLMYTSWEAPKPGGQPPGLDSTDQIHPSHNHHQSHSPLRSKHCCQAKS